MESSTPIVTHLWKEVIMNQLKSLGQKLRELRVEKGAKTQDVAEAVGLAPVSVSNIETGKNLPSMTTLIKLMDYYKITPPELFIDVDTIRPIFESIEIVPPEQIPLWEQFKKWHDAQNGAK